MKKQRLPLNDLLEIGALFGLAIGVGYWIQPEAPLLPDQQPHPFWAVILLVAIRFGNPVSLITGLCCALLHLFGQVTSAAALSERFHLEYATFFIPTLYIVTAVFVSEGVDRYRKRGIYLSTMLSTLREKLTESERRRKDLESSYHNVERRLAGETDTIGHFFEQIRSIEDKTPENIRRNLLSVLEEAFDASKIRLWIHLSDDTWIHHQTGAEEDLPELGRIALREGRAVTAAEFLRKQTQDEEKGLLAGLLQTPGGRLDSVIVVDEIPFLRLTPRSLLFFDILLDWTGQILDRLFLYQEMARRDILDTEFGLTSEAFFWNSAQKLYLQTRRNGKTCCITVFALDSTIAPIVRERLQVVLATILKAVLRKSDLIAHIETPDSLMAFLPDTTSEQARLVCTKLDEALETFGFQPYQDSTPLKLQSTLIECGPDRNLDQVRAELPTLLETEAS